MVLKMKRYAMMTIPGDDGDDVLDGNEDKRVAMMITSGQQSGSPAACRLPVCRKCNCF